MKTVMMYRQPRRAAIVSNVKDEEIHNAFLLRRRKKIQIVLTVVLALFSLSACVFFLYLLNQEPQTTADSSAVSGTVHSRDYLCPDAVDLQSSIAEKVLRLHIRANSDVDCDQEVKLQVRDAVCAYLTLHMDAKTKEEAKAYLSAHLEDVVRVADETLARAGYSYRASAQLTTVSFPLRQYEDFFLPAGPYDTLQIELGTGEGQNWWCILFPTLCLNNALVVERPDKTSLSAQKLAVSLEEKEFEAIQTEHEKITFRFRFLDLLQGRE
ncbi:MAG: stage II sporulation protein R [Lachnospiraceae bacterium]|nr:stage II sporulation protein R [Lachnospiraceae bacterium]